MSKKIIKKDNKTISVFAELLTTMLENNTDNIELSFDLKGLFVKFKIKVLEVKNNGVSHDKKPSK